MINLITHSLARLPFSLLQRGDSRVMQKTGKRKTEAMHQYKYPRARGKTAPRGPARRLPKLMSQARNETPGPIKLCACFYLEQG